MSLLNILMGPQGADPPPFRLMTKSMSVLSFYFSQISDFCFSHLSPTKPVFPSFSVIFIALVLLHFLKRLFLIPLS
jgi:hypothetical protein